MLPEMIIDPPIEQSIYYEVRAAHDAAIWQRDRYVTHDNTGNWLIIQIEPKADSGAATIPGGHIDISTGELKVPEGAQTSIVKSGRWRRLDGTVPTAAAQYHWFEPMVEGKRRLDPEDVYSPFVHGGTLLFAPDKHADGIAQFAAPVLLFDDWTGAVSQALATKLPSEARMAEPSPQIQGGLPRARASANPLVSIWAWRHSLKLDPDRTWADLGMFSGHLLVVHTRLLLDVGGGVSANEAMQAVEATNDLSRLEAMALGAFSAAELPSPGKGEAARKLLIAIAAKAHSVDPNGTARPRLRAILNLAGYARQ